MLCYVAANQVGLFVVVNLLNRAGERRTRAGLLIFNNVFLLMMMAHGIIAVSMMTALMPRMSAAAADGRYADVTADLTRGIRLITAVLAPIAVCYGVLADPDRGHAVPGAARSPPRQRRRHRRRCCWSPRSALLPLVDQPPLHLRLLRAAGQPDAGADQHAGGGAPDRRPVRARSSLLRRQLRGRRA